MRSWKNTLKFLTLLFVLQSSVCLAIPFLHSSRERTPSHSTQPIPKAEIHRLVDTIVAIQRYYIKDVSDKTLFNNAIAGMVTRLDPHSTFLNKEDLKDLQTTVSGEFVGIGIELTTDRGMLRVISPLDGTPAARAGIKPGDLIVKVDDKLIQDMTLREAINHIKGKAGTKVTLTIIRKSESKPLILTLTRAKVKIKSVTSKMLNPGYAYIRLAFFQGPVQKRVRKAIRKMQKGVVKCGC